VTRKWRRRRMHEKKCSYRQERGARNWEEERGDWKRNPKDKMENVEGKKLNEWIEENK
jgi:hypothetical protein